MAPYNLVTATVSLLAKSFTVFSYTGNPARCASVFCSANVNPIKYLTTQASGPPKMPLNGYLRYVIQQKPIMTSQNPEIKSVDIIRKIAQQWRVLSPEQKQPFQKAFLLEMERYKLDLKKYKSQLTPAQLQEQAMEKQMRLKKRKATRKKRELNSLGKPKRPRTAFNIFMSEHFQEARGATLQAKMKSLMEDWKNLSGHYKQVYTQLSEDDKIRYKNEMKSWEEHMLEIGRDDLIRTRSKKKKTAKTSKVKSQTKKAKPKATKATTVNKLKASSKIAQSSTKKT
ncbi:transcription factor A, mitochondrial [Kryptolebias marmoratus]|uniref:Transcription factor A, mitochondrial n=1 Tax=Kryptolebias marmoratus TaxID=37003 RepID=A0A3Q3AYU0_KRYMA|nr:transcription factor A, mitochondrial [Kryptolebias marmoratus]